MLRIYLISVKVLTTQEARVTLSIVGSIVVGGAVGSTVGSVAGSVVGGVVVGVVGSIVVGGAVGGVAGSVVVGSVVGRVVGANSPYFNQHTLSIYRGYVILGIEAYYYLNGKLYYILL